MNVSAVFATEVMNLISLVKASALSLTLTAQCSQDSTGNRPVVVTVSPTPLYFRFTQDVRSPFTEVLKYYSLSLHMYFSKSVMVVSVVFKNTHELTVKFMDKRTKLTSKYTDELSK